MGQFIDEVDAPGHQVMGRVVVDESSQLGRIDLQPRFGHDGHHDLRFRGQFGRDDPERRHFADVGMGPDGLLDGHGGAASSLVPDEVSLAIDEMKLGVFVEASQIPGVIPEVPLGRRGRLGVAEVAVEEDVRLRRSDTELADLSLRHLPVFVIEQADVNPGQR